MLKLHILFRLNKIIFSERCKKVAYNSEVEQEHPDKVVSHPDSTNILKTVQKFDENVYKIFIVSHTFEINMKSHTVIK